MLVFQSLTAVLSLLLLAHRKCSWQQEVQRAQLGVCCPASHWLPRGVGRIDLLPTDAGAEEEVIPPEVD